MKLGACTAVLHDKPLTEALAVLSGLGLESAEINSGGFLPAPHLPIADIRAGQDARQEYLGRFAEAGITLTALNCNGNPLHLDPEVRDEHGQDVRDAIELPALLGVKRVVTMSGLPASDPGGRLSSWSVLPWDSAHLDALDYQWNELAIPYWKDIQARAADADVTVCIEMHPHNLVYNVGTMERLATEIGATHVGAERDPRHLFRQGIDPVAAVRRLGGLVYNAAAKDTRINEEAKVSGVLDHRHERVAADEPGVVGPGGPDAPPGTSSPSAAATTSPSGPSSWRALRDVDPDMAVNIEHEDQELGRIEGLRLAAENLKAAAAGIRPPPLRARVRHPLPVAQ